MQSTKRLLVEGKSDMRVIPYLMEKNGVEWEIDGRPTVHIEASGSVGEILERGVLEAELRASGLEALGIIVDANGNAGKRWKQIRNRSKSEFKELPKQIPEQGLICLHSEGARFGVWIMPDNRMSGALESFLIGLIPQESEKLFSFAKNCVSGARDIGAPLKCSQTTKAELHTWLAWQDEPGRQLHEAVNYRMLDAKNSNSASFARWFRQLFEL